MRGEQMFDRLPALLDLARHVGWGAGEILRQAEQRFQIEKSGESPVTSADLAANEHILSGLITALGETEFAYLSEETHASQPPEERLNHPWVWIIDPLDGTKDFINHTGDYAVHIALVHQGRPVLAVVVCPVKGKLYSAIAGQGSYVETLGGPRTPIKVSTHTQPEQMILLASASHRNEDLERVIAHLPHGGTKAVGSVGGKVAAIVEQQADLYVSISGKSAPKDWDFAAPDLILAEAGGRITRFDGQPLIYNQLDVSQWGGILATNGTCHQTLCEKAQAALG
jgi:3'(2'), 5'-bisphosphate nucleotidase